MRLALWITSAALAAALAVTPGSACAQELRVVVLPFDGPRAAEFEVAIAEALSEEGVGVVSREELEIASSSGYGACAAMERVGAVAFVGGLVSYRRGRVRVEVRVHGTSGVEGSVRIDARAARQLLRGVHGAVSRIQAEIARVARGAGPCTAGEASSAQGRSSASTPPRRDVEGEGEPRDVDPGVTGHGAASDGAAGDGTTPVDSAHPAEAPAALVVWAGGGVTHRDLSYTDDIFEQLSDYTLPAWPSLHGGARWYPGAHFTNDAWAHLGVFTELGGAIGARTRQDGETFPTECWSLLVGLDARVPFEPIELGLALGFGLQSFLLGRGTAGNAAGVVSVEHQLLRPGIRARIAMGLGLYVEPTFGWRLLFGSGELSRWFPRNTGSGLDFGLSLGWESDLGLGARLRVEHSRYFFAFHPEPEDALIAGGVLDQYVSATIDVVWRIR